jgi:hypothetical protein
MFILLSQTFCRPPPLMSSDILLLGLEGCSRGPRHSQDQRPPSVPNSNSRTQPLNNGTVPQSLKGNLWHGRSSCPYGTHFQEHPLLRHGTAMLVLYSGVQSEVILDSSL